MKNKFLYAVSLSLLLVSFSSHSAPITVSFEGTITDLGVLLEGDGVSLNDTITGQFTYDDTVFSSSSTQSLTTGGTLTQYTDVLFSFDLNIGTFSSNLIGSSNFFVQNDAQNGSATLHADGFTTSGSATSTGLNGFTNTSQQFGLRRENVGGQLWNDTLLPSLSDWASITLADINAPDWRILSFDIGSTPSSSFRDNQIRWDVTSFTVTSVPEASSLSLLFLSFISLILARRKR